MSSIKNLKNEYLKKSKFNKNKKHSQSEYQFLRDSEDKKLLNL